MVSFLEMFSDRDVNPLQDREAMIRGEKALGALVETIICDGLDDMNKVQNYGGECRWQYVDPYNGGPESISTAVLHIGWLDDKADFRNVDFSACQKQEYAFPVGERYELTFKPIWMGIDYAAGCEPKKPSNAKPALPALQTVAGDKYRGLGWCDQ